jgi:predicted RNA binding protein YcfA (HicA-like mRNA interferase family)
MRLIPLHRKDLIKKIKKLWFNWPYTWWNHEYLVNNDNFKIIIPNTHSWKDIPTQIISAIIKQLWITRKDFLEL